MEQQSNRPTKVVIVEDDPALADVFAKWVSSDYSTRIAYDAETAIEQIDDSVAVALLDRHMPEIWGDEVLKYIRKQGFDCRVAMVTAVEPGVDIIDMGFDDYVTKPVNSEELLATVDQLTSLAEYDHDLREFYSLSRKLATLQESGPKDETVTEEINALQKELERRRATLDDDMAKIEDMDARSIFRGLSRRDNP